MWSYPALVIAALLLASCTAMGGGMLSFSELDADGDGKISREEAAKARPLMTVFDHADSDGDGYRDREEFQAALELIRASREQDRGHDRGGGARRH